MSKYKRHSLTKIIGVTILIVILVTVGGIWAARRIYDNNLKPVAVNQKSVSVVIPQGTSLKDTAAILKQAGLIRSEWAFTHYVSDKRAESDIKAGTYELSPSYDVSQIVSIITEGKVATNLFTILPGQRLDQIRTALIASGFSAASVDKALDPSLYAQHPALVDKPAGASLEGYLYPESFQKTADTTAEDIIRLSLNEMQKHLTPDIRSAIANQGLSVYKGIILASIAEQEANKPTDRATIIQVFLSRLHMGMNLQSDVTAFYGEATAGQPPSVNFDSPYNTYLHPGLPPGPISNVNLTSLQAVAHPASTDYLYFVAGDDGTVYFARTAAEHQSQVNQYCHKNC